MGRYCRRGFTAAEKQELWDRWSKGESLNSIGRAFGKPSSSIYGHLSPYGGIRPKPRRRSKLSLTLSEREEISRGIAADYSIREIAESLGRSPSTISRGRSAVTRATVTIERQRPMQMPGIEPGDRSRVSWPVIEGCAIR